MITYGMKLSGAGKTELKFEDLKHFPRIPKIILRTASDHFKNTNSAHEKTVTFLLYLTSDPVLGGRGS